MENRIADLEVRLTYQESTLDELNEVIVKQQSQIDVLLIQVEYLRSQLEGQSDQPVEGSDDAPPPHY